MSDLSHSENVIPSEIVPSVNPADGAFRHNFAEATEAIAIVKRLADIQQLLEANDSNLVSKSLSIQHQQHHAVRDGEDLSLSTTTLLDEAKLKARAFISIIDGYLESSHMLDSHLESIVTSLLEIVLKCGCRYQRASNFGATSTITQDYNIKDNPVATSSQSPQNNSHMMQSDQETEIDARCFLNYVFQCLNVLIKVRGYKVVINFFTHDVADLQIAIRLLRGCDTLSGNDWETSYVLLLWLSLIALIPFDLRAVYEAGTEEQTLLSIAMSLGRRYLLTTHKGSEAAGIMISAFLTRAGALPEEQSAMMVWVMSAIRGIVADPAPANSAHQAISILRMLSVVLRLCTRAEAEERLSTTVFTITDLCRGCPELLKQHLVHKLLIKMECRAHLAHLLPRPRGGKYSNDQRRSVAEVLTEGIDTAPDDGQVSERVEDFISITFEALGHPSTGVRYAAAKAIARLAERLPTAEMVDDVCGGVLDTFAESLSDTLWQGGCLALAELSMRGLMEAHHMAQLIDVLCRCLAFDRVIGTKPVGAAVRDAACYLAWALARAYSADILRPYLHQLSNSLILVMCFDREVNCRKAASAAFQEHVGRQGTFKNGISIVTNADYFAVGNRRNSFCVVAPYIAQFEEYRSRLLDHLFSEKLVHWDQKIREVSAAAVRNLAGYDLEYLITEAIPTLIDRCGSNNDAGKRHGCLLGLASTMPALRKLVDAECIIDNSRKVVSSRINEILRRIRTLIIELSMPQVSSGRVSNVNLRVAACTLVHEVCSNGIPIPDTTAKDMESMQNSTARAIVRICTSNAAHPSEKVQMAAADAFGAWCRSIGIESCVKPTELGTVDILSSQESLKSNHSCLDGIPSKRCLARSTIAEYLIHLSRFHIANGTIDTTESSTHRWGYLRVLGAVPRELLMGTENTANTCPECDECKRNTKCLSVDVIRCLYTHSLKQYDVNTRVIALCSIETICQEIGFNYTPVGAEYSTDAATAHTAPRGFDAQIAIQLCDTLTAALSDTTIDHRGDVGSEVRAAGVSLACVILPLLTGADAQASAAPKGSGPESGHTALAGVPAAPDAQADAAQNQPSSENCHTALSGVPVLTSRRCGEIVGLLLEQAMSRIDRLRERAGQVVSVLVWHEDPRLVCIPHLDSLRDMLTSESVRKEFNWGSMEETLPVLLHTLAIPDYRPYAIRALVLCIGAGNESTICVAQDALASYCLSSTANELCLIIDEVCSIFRPGGPDTGRLTMPCLETLSCLLSEAVPTLTAAAADRCDTDNSGVGIEQQTFDTVLTALKPHMKTTNIQKHTAVASALCQLIQVKSVQIQALKLLSVLLGHRFDHVRVMAVDQLNLALLTYEDAFDAPLDDAMCLLDELRSLTDLREARDCRNRICDELGIPAPQTVHR